MTHPGGKAIVEGIESACELDRSNTQNTWDILRDYGNMSSGTILFVLDKLMTQSMKDHVISFGFGPGLSVEGLLLKNET